MVTFSRILIMSIVASSLLIAEPVLARKNDDIKALQEEVEAIKQGQEQIHKDLEEIKKLLKDGARAAPKAPSRPAFKPTDIQLGEVNYRGEFDAPVTLIEYSDYHCPYCKRHAQSVMPALLKDYVDKGQVRFIMREYPIDRLHSRATAASRVALCAGEQGQYWEMHDALFADQKATSDEHFQQLVADLGLDSGAFNECITSERIDKRIKANLAEGQKLGVSGTPSFVVGLTDADKPDNVHLTKFIRGAQSQQAFAGAIDELLKTAKLEGQ